jgi:hypothetical protein
VPRTRKEKGHLELARDNAIKVLTESATVLLVLGCAWLIGVAAIWLFVGREGCRTSTETTIYGVQGDGKTPTPLIQTRTIEDRCVSR